MPGAVAPGVNGKLAWTDGKQRTLGISGRPGAAVPVPEAEAQIMGWKDLFKSKAEKAKPDPRLRWFGKLPTYADYYSSATDEDWAVDFNDWILKGCELFFDRQGTGKQDRRVPSSVCILRLPTFPMTILASVQDYGGDMRGRPFPHIFYVGVPTVSWPGPTSAGVLPAMRVLRDLLVLRDEVDHFFNAPGRFEARFGGREVDLSGLDADVSDDSWLPAAQKLPLPQWFESAKGGLKTDDMAKWCETMLAWGDNIATLEADEFGPTFRFPLVTGIPSEVQVAGWLRWLESRMNLKERYLSLLMSADPAGSTGHLSVVARELVGEDFLLLTPKAGSLSYVDDASALGGAPTTESEQTDAEPESPAPADSVQTPATWAEFVEVTPGA